MTQDERQRIHDQGIIALDWMLADGRNRSREATEDLLAMLRLGTNETPPAAKDARELAVRIVSKAVERYVQGRSIAIYAEEAATEIERFAEDRVTELRRVTSERIAALVASLAERGVGKAQRDELDRGRPIGAIMGTTRRIASEHGHDIGKAQAPCPA